MPGADASGSLLTPSFHPSLPCEKIAINASMFDAHFRGAAGGEQQPSNLRFVKLATKGSHSPSRKEDMTGLGIDNLQIHIAY
jgi:hypothetical protein